MGVLSRFSHVKNSIKSINKIPEYAKNFKKEYLIIRAINKSLHKYRDYYLCSVLDSVKNYNKRIKKYIKGFYKFYKGDKLTFKLCDVKNIYELDNYTLKYLFDCLNDYEKFGDLCDILIFFDIFCEFQDKLKSVSNIID